MSARPKDRNRRVLVIDDMRSIHDDFRKILGRTPVTDGALQAYEDALFAGDAGAESASFSLDFAFQGEEGYGKVREALAAGQPYAVAFVDVRMPPGWDGIETIEKIWSVDPDVQVVVCTAYSDYSWTQMAARLGPTDRMVILRKPFDNIEVLQLATALSEKWHLLQTSRARVGSLETDVAARTRELELALTELRRSEELFRTLSACAPIGIWLVDGEGQCRYANARWSAISGLPIEQTLGHGWARAVHPEDMAEVVQAWAASGSGQMSREFRVRRPDQTIRWVFLQSAPTRTAQGQVTGRVATISDITEQKVLTN